MINITNIITFIIGGILQIKELSIIFTPLILLILLNGLISRSDFKSPCIPPPNRFLILIITTMKSIMFQPLRRYDPFPNTNPQAMIFKMHSIMNIQVTDFEIVQRMKEMFSSPLVSRQEWSFWAMLIALTMMQKIKKLSNHLHSHIQTQHFLIQFLDENKNSEFSGNEYEFLCTKKLCVENCFVNSKGVISHTDLLLRFFLFFFFL